MHPVTVRGRAVVARRAHNPEVVGSSPAPATKTKALQIAFVRLFCFQKCMKDLSAMIFAAGLGTRLYPLTADKPKALVEVNGITLLEHAIRKITGSGIHHIVVNVHHYADQMIEFLNTRHFDAQITISHERDILLDTAGGLKFASSHFPDSQHILLYNVDILSSIDLKKMVSFHLSQDAISTVAVRRRDTARYLIFDSRSMELCGWLNKKTGETIIRKETEYPVELAFSGIHVVRKDLIDKIPAAEKISLVPLYLDLVPAEIIVGYQHQEDTWMDVGNYENYLLISGRNV